ncbi:MAG: hypothetical protein V3S69_07915 [Dehalococcoidales bacterium]
MLTLLAFLCTILLYPRQWYAQVLVHRIVGVNLYLRATILSLLEIAIEIGLVLGVYTLWTY